MPMKFSALIAEDDFNVREVLKRTLRKYGIDADGARDGLAAKAMLSQKSYDVLVTDLRMPRMHGHQLIMEVLEHRDHPMIVVVTGVTEPKIAMDLFSRGVVALETKPVKSRDVAAKIRGMLEYRRRVHKAPGNSGAELPSADKIRSEINQVTASFEDAISRLRRQQEELEKGFLGSVRLLTGLINHKDMSTSVHANRVERMAIFMAKRLGLLEDQMRDIQLAALLHEIGQFSMPDRVKQTAPWLLPPNEREQYERYPSLGATLLSEIHGAESIAHIVECHAENFDGSGYPNGLTGMDIPIGARIVRMADGYDTCQMFSEGTDRLEVAKKSLADNLGKCFDPELFPHALAYMRDELERLNHQEMESVPADQLVPEMELAENVYDNEGRFLARRGAILSPSLVARLSGLLGAKTVQVLAPTEHDEAGSPEPE